MNFFDLKVGTKFKAYDAGGRECNKTFQKISSGEAIVVENPAKTYEATAFWKVEAISDKCPMCGQEANCPKTRWAYGMMVEICRDKFHTSFTGEYLISLYTAIVPITIYPFEGYMWMEIHCEDYETYSRQPAAIQYQGAIYGRTGWNSDYGRAYYTTRQTVGFGV